MMRSSGAAAIVAAASSTEIKEMPAAMPAGLPAAGVSATESVELPQQVVRETERQRDGKQPALRRA
jgi:hypothetical protein